MEHEEVSEEIETLIRRLRRKYISEKRARVPTYKLPARFQQAIGLWRKAAESCLSAEADPDDWVLAAFAFNAVPGGPFPNQLGGPKALEWWKQFAGTGSLETDKVNSIHVTPPARLVKFDFAVLADAVKRAGERDPPDTLEDVLLDPLEPIRAYVRVVAGQHIAAVLAKYLEEGKNEVRGSKVVLDAIQDLGFDPSILE